MLENGFEEKTVTVLAVEFGPGNTNTFCWACARRPAAANNEKITQLAMTFLFCIKGRPLSDISGRGRKT
jgi:hypothetical protein